jgi:hypothetical protein
MAEPNWSAKSYQSRGVAGAMLIQQQKEALELQQHMLGPATPPTPATEDSGVMRTYSTGATRDTSEGKPVHWRFSSALVEKRYGEYMHAKRVQSDGNIRAGDNWKHGIPVEDYFDSLSRHISDLKLIKEGFPGEAADHDLETVLCAIKFNVDGMLHEILKERAG